MTNKPRSRIIHAPRGASRAVTAAALVAALLLPVNAVFAESPDEMFKRGKRLAELGNFAEAIEVLLDFQTEFEDDKRIAEAQFLVGRYQQQRNYLNKAMEEYDYVIEDFAKTEFAALAYGRKAEILIHMEEWEKARATLEKLAKEFDGHMRAFFGLRVLGDLYLGDKGQYPTMPDELKDDPKAVDTFNRLIAYDAVQLLKKAPSHVERSRANRDIHRGVFFLADRAIKDKEYEAAKHAYTRLPNMWEKVQKLIELLDVQEKEGEIYDLISEMEGKNYWRAQNFWLELCIRHRKQGLRKMKSMIKKLTSELPPSRDLAHLLHRFDTLTATDRAAFTDEIRVALFELIATRYRPLRREFEYKICYIVWGKQPGACERFIQTYEKGGDVEQCKKWRGHFYELKKERAKAQVEYWRMVNKPVAHFLVAETYHGELARMAGNRDLRLAIKEYMEIRRRFYDTNRTCKAYWIMGHLHAELNEKDKAVSVLAELEKRFVGQPRWQTRARYQIAQWQRHWARYEDAVDSYRMVDKRYPRTTEQQLSVYNIGLCWEGLGKKEKAIRSFLECIKRFQQTSIQSQAHSRLEVKYKIPDLMIKDMVKDLQ